MLTLHLPLLYPCILFSCVFCCTKSSIYVQNRQNLRRSSFQIQAWLRKWRVVLDKMLGWIISSLIHTFSSSRHLSLGICTCVHPGYHSKGEVLLLLPGFSSPVWLFQLPCICGHRGAFSSGTIDLFHDNRKNYVALQLLTEWFFFHYIIWLKHCAEEGLHIRVWGTRGCSISGFRTFLLQLRSGVSGQYLRTIP